jgi:hypothetical protein
MRPVQRLIVPRCSPLYPAPLPALEQRHVREALLGLQLAHPLPAALVDELAYKLPTTLYGVRRALGPARCALSVR